MRSHFGVAFSIALLAAGLGGCKDVTSVLRKYNYLTQVPPVAFHGPGDIVWKRGESAGAIIRSRNTVSLGYICNPEYVTKKSKPLESPTESTTLAKSIGGNISFDGASVASGLGVSAAATAVRRVDLKIENVKVLQYSLETLYEIRNSLGPVCRGILAEQQRKGNAYQVISAVRADVSYTVTFNSGVSSTTKARLKNEIGAKLGLDVNASTGKTGKGLFYGVELRKL